MGLNVTTPSQSKKNLNIKKRKFENPPERSIPKTPQEDEEDSKKIILN